MRLHEHLNTSGHLLFRFRSFLPVLLFIPGLYLYFNSPMHLSSALELLAFVVSFIGLGIRAYVIGFAYERSSGRNTDKQIADQLNTLDIYSMCRNPLYLGNFFMWLGVVLFIGSFSFSVVFILIFCLFYERIIFTEEQFLAQKFGAVYNDWAAKTPVFFPNPRLYKASGKHFDWLRVLRQEKNGVLALFLIFAVLEVAEMLAQDGRLHRDNDLTFFLTGLLASILLYSYFKIQKYRHHA